MLLSSGTATEMNHSADSIDISNSIILRPSKRKIILMLVGSLILALNGFSLYSKDGMINIIGLEITYHHLSYFIITFFGFCFASLVIMAMPNAAYLQLDVNGFEYCTWFHKSRLSWNDVSEFGVYHIDVLPMIGFKYSTNSPRKPKISGPMSSLLSGWEGSLPDTYGQDPVKLAELMNILML